MLAKVLGYLVLVGIGHIPFLNARYQKFFAFAGFLAAGAVLFMLYQGNLTDSAYTFEWINLKNYRLKIRINTNPETLTMLMPCLAIMLSSMLYNIIYTTETARIRINLIAVFCGVNLIFLVCSQNISQLIIAASFSTVLGYTIINDVFARRKFVFYNLAADMSLFMLIAMLRAQTDNAVNIELISTFSHLFEYKDVLVGFLLLFAFVKAGLFSFHNALTDMSYIKSNRQIMVAYLSTPIAAVITLYKLRFMIDFTSGAAWVIEVVAALTIAWAAWAALIVDNIKKKTMYLNIMMYALICALIACKQIDIAGISHMVMASFLVNVLFVLIINASSNEDYVSKMGGFIKVLKFTFLASVLVVGVFALTLQGMANARNIYWLYGYGAAVLIVTANTFRQAYFGKATAGLAGAKNPGVLFFVPIAGIGGYLIWVNMRLLPDSTSTASLSSKLLSFAASSIKEEVWIAPASFAALILAVMLLKPLDRIYKNIAVQKSEFFYEFYNHLIVLPVKIVGKVLMITIDFLLIERTITSSIAKFNDLAAAGFQKMHKVSVVRYAILAAAGFSIMFYFFGVM